MVFPAIKEDEVSPTEKFIWKGLLNNDAKTLKAFSHISDSLVNKEPRFSGKSQHDFTALRNRVRVSRSKFFCKLIRAPKKSTASSS